MEREHEDADHEGPSLPEQMMFDFNLRDFASRVGLIVSLEAGGKISQAAAYQKIRDLWKQLKNSKKQLRIGDQEENRGPPK